MCNGLVWPDRTPHPAAYELKYLQAPLAIGLEQPGQQSEQDAELQQASAQPGGAPLPAWPAEQEARLWLRNKQHFSSGADLALTWRLLADGRPCPARCKDGWRPLEAQPLLGPQQGAAVGLGCSWGDLAQQAQGAAEAVLEVRAQVGPCPPCCAVHTRPQQTTAGHSRPQQATAGCSAC